MNDRELAGEIFAFLQKAYPEFTVADLDRAWQIMAAIKPSHYHRSALILAFDQAYSERTGKPRLFKPEDFLS